MELLKPKKIGKTAEPEPLVKLPVIMEIYGNKKSWWNEARAVFGCPYYDLGNIYYRISEVEQWIQSRKRINTI